MRLSLHLLVMLLLFVSCSRRQEYAFNEKFLKENIAAKKDAVQYCMDISQFLAGRSPYRYGLMSDIQKSVYDTAEAYIKISNADSTDVDIERLYCSLDTVMQKYNIIKVPRLYNNKDMQQANKLLRENILRNLQCYLLLFLSREYIEDQGCHLGAGYDIEVHPLDIAVKRNEIYTGLVNVGRYIPMYNRKIVIDKVYKNNTLIDLKPLKEKEGSYSGCIRFKAALTGHYRYSGTVTVETPAGPKFFKLESAFIVEDE